jgi:hypothetical protein
MRKFVLILTAIVAVGVVLTQVTYIPKSSAAEFGVGILDCAAAVGPTSANAKLLETNGWQKRDSSGGSDRYHRSDVNVQLIVKTGVPSCLMQGFAKNDDQFPAIVDAISAALKDKYREQFIIQSSNIPNKRTYKTGNLLHVLSAKETSDGYQVRVTSIWDHTSKQ